MIWLWLVLVGWLLLSVPLALLIGGGVRLAERREAVARTVREVTFLPQPNAASSLLAHSAGRRAG